MTTCKEMPIFSQPFAAKERKEIKEKQPDKNNTPNTLPVCLKPALRLEFFAIIAFFCVQLLDV
jgi:hypothetical protein